MRFAIGGFLLIIVLNILFVSCEINRIGETEQTDSRSIDIRETLNIRILDATGAEASVSEYFGLNSSVVAEESDTNGKTGAIYWKYFLNFSMQILLYTVILLWFIFDGRFKKNLDQVLSSHYIQHATYRNLLESYKIHRQHCSEKPRKAKLANRVKRIFAIVWFAAALLFTVILWSLELPLVMIAVSTILLLGSMILNHTSYFLCFVFVWFLKGFSEIKDLESYPFLKQMPSKTGAFLIMKRIANENAIVFFIVSLLFAVTVSIVLQFPHEQGILVLDQNTNILLLFLAGFLTLIFCLLSFVSLFASSKFFFSVVLNRWKSASSARLEIEANGAFQSILKERQPQHFQEINAMTEVIQNVYSKQSPHLFDLIAVILALLQLMVAVIMLFHVFSPT
jgi:hypothetical protein